MLNKRFGIEHKIVHQYVDTYSIKNHGALYPPIYSCDIYYCAHLPENRVLWLPYVSKDPHTLGRRESEEESSGKSDRKKLVLMYGHHK